MKKSKKVFAFLVSILVVFALALPIKFMAAEKGNEKVLHIRKGVDLKTAPECEIVGKEDLTIAFSTLLDDNDKEYFCLDLWLRYPQGEGDDYVISDSSEVTSDSVRWLVYNYNTNRDNYFAGVNSLTAYGATQLAIWHYTDDFTQLEAENPLVRRLVDDAANASFPSVESTLDGYSANVTVDSEEMVLENGSYVGYFTTNLIEPTVKNANVSVQDSKIEIFNGSTNITNDPNVSVEQISENRYKVIVHDDLLNEIDTISVKYTAVLVGEGDTVLQGFPVEGNWQSVASFEKITLTHQVEANGRFIVQEIGDVIFVSKVDMEGNIVPGAEFILTDNTGDVQVGVTDENGEVYFTITAGKVYTLEETKNPQGYKGTFKQEGITLQNSGEAFFYTVENELFTGNIEVAKVDKEGLPLPYAEFTLTDEVGNIITGMTDADGFLSFEIEANKVYTLEETKNPYGYKGTFKQEGITLANDGEVFTYTVENELLTGNIEVAKVDQTGKPLAGAEFTLTDEAGNIKTGVTGADGILSFTIEANNVYILEETKNPQGFKGTFKQEGITLANDGEVFTYTVENEAFTGNIQVTKVDTEGNPLTGAEFILTDDDGNIVTGVTDADGLLNFAIEGGKSYTLEETKNPQGYKGTFKQEGITLVNDGEIFTYTVENELIKGNIQVTKVDKEGNSLEGAEFTLMDNDGNIVTGVTDADGLLNFEIEGGKSYTLEETKNPQGYKGTFRQEGITLVNDGEIFTYTVENELIKGNIQVTKVDKEGNLLEGAEFTLTDEVGNVMTGVTDTNGLLSFEIEVGKTYTLEETKNPEGYKGTFKHEGITIKNDGEVFKFTVVNERDGVLLNESNDPGTPAVNGTPPSTGDSNNIVQLSILFMSSAVLLTFFLGTYIMKKDRKNG